VDPPPLKAGIIGLDTSHVEAFTALLNNPRASGVLARVRVVAAYSGGSPDIPESRDRVAGYTRKLRDEYKVEIVNSIEALLEKVDVVFLESVDGRPHLEQARPVLRARTRMFIDKPVAGSLADAMEIYRLAKECNTPIFSSSSLRFSPGILGMRDNPKVGKVLGCSAYGPCALEPHHPDLFWYGIHTAETLFTIMGPGCASVTRVHAADSDFVTGTWKDGRVGTLRGIRKGKYDYGAMVFGSDGNAPSGGYAGYEPLVVEICKFFLGGPPPVSPEETLEIYAFMEAADESKRRGGAPVTLASVLEKARAAKKPADKQDPTVPPPTAKRPVTDTYHGVRVTDDYRWLEDWNNKEVRAWSDAQNAYARSILDKLPGTAKLRSRLTSILSAPTTNHFGLVYRGGRLFALRRQPPKEQPFLVVLPAVDAPDRARVLLDPTARDKQGKTAIDWYVPSPDGSLVAVSLSHGGSESGDVHILETASGKEVFEVVPRVNGGTAGGDLAWSPDGKGFFYTRYPRGKERPPEDLDFYQQVYYHRLGTPTESDRYELGKELPRIAEVRLECEPTSGRVLASVQNGDGGEFAHYLRNPDGRWTQFTAFKDGVVDAAFGPRDDIYLVSRQNAPRGKILRVSAVSPDLARAGVVVPEGTDTIVTDFSGRTSRQTVLPTAARLYVIYQLGGPTQVRAFDIDGRPQQAPKQLPISTVGDLARVTGDDLIFANGSYVEPRNHYLYRARSNETVKLPLATPPPVDFRDIEVVREFAVSKDGTKVPVNILIPKGAKRDGRNPCLVTGYGGYGISRVPGFHPDWRVLFDHGFVVAEANLRGGGEFGEAWHKAGALTEKQNVFDDFTAVLRHLIARGYTSPPHLAIQGGSNGGLLMGAVLTQHPELMKAVVSFVGIYDMLRVELSPNGAFNVPEFGTVKDAKQFQALYAYSPYHHVKDGVKYPAVLFLTGANDPRVDPMQSRKMTVRLQAAGARVLLRTSAGSGHGLDTSLSERIEELVDVYAFLFAQLGVTP
jgi:prolyl oligopeptidase